MRLWLFLLAVAGPVQADEIAALVDRLGSSRFAEREAAGRALETLGEKALPELDKARNRSDPEINGRAGALYRKIQNRVLRERLLAGSALRLSFKDASLAPALDELARTTGFPMQLAGSSDRKITLDTGATTFWQALDRFTREAGLIEKWRALPVAPANPYSSGQANPYIPISSFQFAPVRKELNLPTYYAGAIRFRAVPAERDRDGAFLLDVAPEPRLRWHGVVSVRFGKVVDDLGDELALPEPYLVPAIKKDSPAFPVLLPRLRATTKALKEVQGTITARVEVQQQVAIPDILRTAGKTFAGQGAERIHVLEVEEKQDNGVVQLRLRLEKVELGAEDQLYSAIRVRPGFAALLGPTDVLAARLHLLDGKGRPFERAGYTGRALPAKDSYELTVTFQPQAGQAAAARLHYLHQRQLTVDVPFTLNSIPLP